MSLVPAPFEYKTLKKSNCYDGNYNIKNGNKKQEIFDQ